MDVGEEEILEGLVFIQFNTVIFPFIFQDAEEWDVKNSS
jgi:hypothetical protein